MLLSQEISKNIETIHFTSRIVDKNTRAHTHQKINKKTGNQYRKRYGEKIIYIIIPETKD
jgi:hypothetical protein